MNQLHAAPTAANFEPLGPLPRGRTAIEASAGTGKTHALATLATRFVAEDDVTASELLIVTFTRAAANELRAKVRQRLVDTAELLASGSPGSDTDLDRLAVHLAADDCAERTRRLQQAVPEFDAATVTTIHGFAFQVRAALGTGSGAEPTDRILSDHRAVLREACVDVLAGAAVGPEARRGLPDLDALLRIVDQFDGRPDLALFPEADDPGVPPELGVLADLVRRSAELAERRRRDAGRLSFDDVLTRFRNVLLDPSIGASAARYLGARYRVVLIDEFQDTDPVQWDIFSRLFGSADSRNTLVLVGDPKQSIYGFRGADVHTYRRAVDDPATVRQVLATNWRSDEALLDALSALMTGASFGVGIDFQPVEASPTHCPRRMFDARGEPLPALALRLAVGEDIPRDSRHDERVLIGAAKGAILCDLAMSLRTLLEGGRLPDAEGTGPGGPVRPEDIAVLVPRNQDALDVQSALRDVAIPAVVRRAGSVLESEAATQLRWLLHAMERPSDLSRVRLAALSWFGGWTAQQVADAGDDDPDDDLGGLQERLRAWADALGAEPVAAVLTRIRSDSGVVSRLLARADGDRNVTDLDHLTELLGSATSGGRSGPATLLACLEEEPDPSEEGDAIIDVDEDLTARRLESDADCVQVMTTWTAKGLEFPVVCLPMLWWEPTFPSREYLEPGSGRRTIDLTAGKRDYRDYREPGAGTVREDLVDRESEGERLRTLYVALTRAQHLNLVWWARTQGSECSALARLLFARTDGRIDVERFSSHRVSVPSGNEIVDCLEPMVKSANGRHAGAMAVEVIVAASRVEPWQDAAAPTAWNDLEVRVAPTVDRRYQRWSFSAIVNRAAAELADPADDSLADAGASDEVELDLDEEEVFVGGGATSEATTGVAGVNPMANLMGGTAFGTLVHSVLERVDWQASDLDAALGEATDTCVARRPVELATAPGCESDEPALSGRSRLIAGMRTVLDTPLGAPFENRRLVDIGPADRLCELDFDLRLGTGGRLPTTRALGEVVGDGLSAGDPFSLWADALSDGSHDLVLAGNLTGSIDLVARVKGADGHPRFVIADYKTNALHAPGQVATAADYLPDRMAAAMVEHDYPLQALLYCVALHRYLRWRFPGYRPDRHLGGTAYLFVRGMDGGASADGVANGVFSWTVPPQVVERLSDLLDGALVGAVA